MQKQKGIQKMMKVMAREATPMAALLVEEKRTATLKKKKMPMARTDEDMGKWLAGAAGLAAAGVQGLA
jgi:hypothetical protein